MLVLTRKKDEAIIIQDNIEIVIADIQGDQVKIGIRAPKNISIHRKEIYTEIMNENKKAADNRNVSLDALKEQMKKEE